MTIAYREFEGIGARVFTPEGPFTSMLGNQGAIPSNDYAPGTVIAGDAESEYVAVWFAPPTAVTFNQGDCFWWDQSYMATPVQGTVAGAAALNMSVGAFFLGGRVGDPAVQSGLYWSFTFQPGIYLMWVQRAGTAVLNIATGGTQAKPAASTAVAGQLAQPAAAVVGTMAITPVASANTSQTFTANTVSGSAILTNISSNKFLVRGQIATGAGIPANTYIADFSGTTVTLSQAATATAAGVTVTAANAATFGNVTINSPVITGVPVVPGIYPNQTIAGTGIPASTTILSITGVPGAYTITMSANATATNVGVALTTTGYQEGFLRWPQVSGQN